MPGENVQHAHSKFAVLVLLAPNARRRIHERSERAVSPTQRPHPGKLFWIYTGALPYHTNRTRDIPSFLDRGFHARAERISLRIVMTPQAAVFHIDGFRKIRGKGDEAIVGDVVHPLDNFRDTAPRAGHLARFPEKRNGDLLLRARDSVRRSYNLWIDGKVGHAQTIVQERVHAHVKMQWYFVLDRSRRSPPGDPPASHPGRCDREATSLHRCWS